MGNNVDEMNDGLMKTTRKAAMQENHAS